MVVTWLVARIILFMYLFHHMFVHYDQIKKMNPFGYFLVFIAPCIIFLMNVLWFSKIVKGLKETIAKRHTE
uniref:TLC domain-containing protein n=1 Tax=Triticum urartu TaxID=4572 RepID=A0A8R7K633_TRIUA